jgi:ribokinase
LYRALDVLTPNETEAMLLTGEATAEAAAAALLERGPRTVLITLGEAGVLAAEAGQRPRRLPAFHVNVVDSTAAGDAFNGALAVALARSMDLATAVRYAQAAAALSVTRRGAQPSLPRAAEVETFLAQHTPV